MQQTNYPKYGRGPAPWVSPTPSARHQQARFFPKYSSGSRMKFSQGWAGDVEGQFPTARATVNRLTNQVSSMLQYGLVKELVDEDEYQRHHKQLGEPSTGGGKSPIPLGPPNTAKKKTNELETTRIRGELNRGPIVQAPFRPFGEIGPAPDPIALGRKTPDNPFTADFGAKTQSRALKRSGASIPEEDTDSLLTPPPIRERTMRKRAGMNTDRMRTWQ